MSIPPLVCSTPPPPDQCEDDNDNEYFDIPYNLSQEDEDEDDTYDYGHFSYNHCTVTAEVKKDNGLCNIETLTISESKETTIPEEIEHSIENDHNLKGNNIVNNNITKCDEDPNIEDLDLKINEPEIFSNKEEQISDHSSDNSEKFVNTFSEIEASPERAPSPSNDITTDKTKDLYNSEETVKFQTNSLNVIPVFEELQKQQNSCIGIVDDNQVDNNDLQTETEVIDDEFGDFEDFQCVNSISKPTNTIETSDNPWINQSNSEDNDFGHFTATFESTDVQELSISVKNMDNFSQNNSEVSKVNNDDDDDFGDFDDFKSSAVEDQSKENEGDCVSNTVPVLNFQMSDNEVHVMESISKVLSSIFEEEISEPEREFEGSLESVLGVSWGHLRETDIRQPYILNWNNSLGQKTLLKALCIDSRNILFGPKWGYTAPKYAANLGVAPLQPQKPLTPSNSGHNEASIEKTKPGNWVDSFASDGQESCNADSEVPVEVKPSDLDMFEAAVSSKPDKIYSSTLSVQPLRQISLPDTHIFTPTDSETPRSKTIHYDSGPPILLPQPVLENVKKPENPILQTDHIQQSKDDEDYWEFRDYRSNTETTLNTPSSLQTASEPLEQTSESKVFNPNITYQTQVLQPVKMEPIMPKLNWPDPGEVKETFEDFSDFISNTSWAKDNNSQPSTPSLVKATDPETEIGANSNDKFKFNIKNEPTTNVAQDIDDDFDTFQSALPPKNPVEFNFNHVGANKFNNIPNQTNPPSQTFPQMADIDFAFSNNIRQEAIPHTNLISNEIQSFSNTANTADLHTKPISSLPNHMHSSILQPVLANTSATPANAPFSTQQNTGQILQPLSLESYSQINWPSPGIDLQDLSKFNPVENLQSLKTDLSASGPSKTASPVHIQKQTVTVVNNQVTDDDIWGDFVSIKPKQQPLPKKPTTFADDDEWTDFVSSPTVKPINGLNTISLNVHTNSNVQKSANNKLIAKGNQLPLDIPTLNYITPKTSGHNAYNNRHFENL